MSDYERQRQEQEQRELAELLVEGRRWAAFPDEYLVGYVAELRPSQFHTPAIVEMQRRQAAAAQELLGTIRQFNVQSEKYSSRIEILTWAMLALAVAQLVAAVTQLVVEMQ